MGTVQIGIAWDLIDDSIARDNAVIDTDLPECPLGYIKTYPDLVECMGKWYYGDETHRIIMEGTDFSGKPVHGTNYRKYRRTLYDKNRKGELISDVLLEAFVQELTIMKEIAFENMKVQMLRFDKENFDREKLDDQIQWVLMVPEEATEKDKDFMRKAAKKAGIIREPGKECDKILFVGEAEAVIISYMKGKNNNYFTGMIAERERNIIVYDVGGETVDVTVKGYHKRNGRWELYTIMAGAQEAVGSTDTVYEFFKYLTILFSKTPLNLQAYLDKDRTLCASLLNEWEKFKEKISMWEES